MKDISVPAGAAPIASKRDRLLQLRDRLRTATGPSYGLDASILKFTNGAEVEMIDGFLGIRFPDGSVEPSGCMPKFTASIDAAVTLVPSDMLVDNLGEMRDSGPLTGQWLAQISPRGPRPRHPFAPFTATSLRSILDAEPVVRAASPALALCLARVEYELAKTAEGPDDTEEQGRSVIAEHANNLKEE